MLYETPESTGLPLLLRKPLAVGGGGSGHEGEDVWGNDVYRFGSDPGYLVLLNWVQTMEGAAVPAPPAAPPAPPAPTAARQGGAR